MDVLTGKEAHLLQRVERARSFWEKITVRMLQKALGYASPRSISVLMKSLTEKWWLYRDERGSIHINRLRGKNTYETRSIPLIGTIACGSPVLAEENRIADIPLSESFLEKNGEYFFLRAHGDSMNRKGIEDGDIVLIQRNTTFRNGDIVVAVINDEATLKEFRQEKGVVYLIPHSSNPFHKTIILDRAEWDIFLQGIFVRSFPWSLF